MSTRQREARQRAREILAQRKRAEQRRKRVTVASVTVVAVLLTFGIVALVKLSMDDKKPLPLAASASPAPAEVINSVTKVQAGTYDTVGKGKVDALPTMIANQQVLKNDKDKPLVVYIGAEYCPFCASARWAVVAALSRFGTFSNLSVTHSSPDDSYPNTATLSFHGATYTSDYFEFQGVELQSNEREGNGYKTLDTPTPLQQQLLKTYNAPPYVDKEAAGSIPFMDFGNQGIIAGSPYSPKLLEGKSAKQIADLIGNTSSSVSQAVLGSANVYTALICRLTNNQPGDVCGSKAVTAAQEVLGAAPKK